MKSEFSELSEQEILDKIDSSLRFVRRLGEEDSHCAYGVYLVLQENEPRLFKLNCWDDHDMPYIRRFRMEHLKKEAEALKRAIWIPHVPRLMYDYGKRANYHAILKEYIPGTPLSQLGLDNCNPQLMEQLEQQVADLHKNGIVNLEIWPRHILVSQDRSFATLYDFGSARFREEFGSESHPLSFYEKYRKEDIEMLLAAFNKKQEFSEKINHIRRKSLSRLTALLGSLLGGDRK